MWVFFSIANHELDWANKKPELVWSQCHHCLGFWSKQFLCTAATFCFPLVSTKFPHKLFAWHEKHIFGETNAIFMPRWLPNPKPLLFTLLKQTIPAMADHERNISAVGWCWRRMWWCNSESFKSWQMAKKSKSLWRIGWPVELNDIASVFFLNVSGEALSSMWWANCSKCNSVESWGRQSWESQCCEGHSHWHKDHWFSQVSSQEEEKTTKNSNVK